MVSHFLGVKTPDDNQGPQNPLTMLCPEALLLLEKCHRRKKRDIVRVFGGILKYFKFLKFLNKVFKIPKPQPYSVPQSFADSVPDLCQIFSETQSVAEVLGFFGRRPKIVHV